MSGVLKLLTILIVLCVELNKANQHVKDKKVNVLNHAARQVSRAASACIDKASNCKQFLEQCNDSGYKSLLQKNCAETCGYCMRQANRCTDAFPNSACQQWKKQGYCEGSAPIQQKRAYCSKTCNLCQGPSPTVDCTDPRNAGKTECKKNNPTVDCTDPRNAGRVECKSPTVDCTDPRNADKVECKKDVTDDNCNDENDLKTPACLRSNCQDINKRYTPECLHFCAEKPNKKSWQCHCGKKPFSDDRCMVKFCKANPTDASCMNFCEQDENKNVVECLCVLNKMDAKCLSETCKDHTTYQRLAACITYCNVPQNKNDDPNCIQYGTATDCTQDDNKFKLACLRRDPFVTPNPGTDCTTPANSGNINCETYCSDPKVKFTKNCLNCALAENRFHFNCLSRTCHDAAYTNDTTCKEYCQKVRGTPAPC